MSVKTHVSIIKIMEAESHSGAALSGFESCPSWSQSQFLEHVNRAAIINVISSTCAGAINRPSSHSGGGAN